MHRGASRFVQHAESGCGRSLHGIVSLPLVVIVCGCVGVRLFGSSRQLAYFRSLCAEGYRARVAALQPLASWLSPLSRLTWWSRLPERPRYMAHMLHQPALHGPCLHRPTRTARGKVVVRLSQPASHLLGDLIRELCNLASYRCCIVGWLCIGRPRDERRIHTIGWPSAFQSELAKLGGFRAGLSATWVWPLEV